LIRGLYAALKRRSSTVLHAFVGFSVASEVAPFQNELRLHYDGPRLHCEFQVRDLRIPGCAAYEFLTRNYDVAGALILPRFPVVLLNVDQLLIEGWVWRTLCFA
jgi:hypothetical protein